MSWGRNRRNVLADKIRDSAAGKEVSFDPAEFVLFVLYREGAEKQSAGNIDDYPHKIDDEKRLSAKMGYTDAYVGDMLHKIHPKFAISSFMAHKLAHMSGTTPSFWQKEQYPAKDAEGVSFDMQKDASNVAVPHTGSHVQRRQRIDAEQNTPFDGRGIA